jgi:hypothetical protein
MATLATQLNFSPRADARDVSCDHVRFRKLRPFAGRKRIRHRLPVAGRSIKRSQRTGFAWETS